MFVNLSSSICMVSCVTKVGIRELQERIHSAALSAKDPDTHEHVIGMQVFVQTWVQALEYKHAYVHIYFHLEIILTCAYA